MEGRCLYVGDSCGLGRLCRGGFETTRINFKQVLYRFYFMAPDNLDAAVVFSRTSVAQAKLQRLIGKWMPKKETEPEEDIEPEDTKLFVAGPEMYARG